MGSCSTVRPIVDKIVSLMTVPLVQGTLRYAWKVGKTGGVDNKLADQSAKNAAEGSTFAAAVLPLVHACDAAAAKVVSDNMKFGAAIYTATTAESDSEYTSGTKPDTGAVKAALEKTYSCLGITCAHVGGLLNGDETAAEAGMEACTHAPYIAGYWATGTGSVSEHNELDLDQAEMETALGAKDYPLAKTWYTVGGNSKTAAPFRTLQGFSTGAQAKMYTTTAGEGGPYKHYKQFYDYYGSFTYADDWATAALDGTTLTYAAPAGVSFNFGTAHDNARKEAVKKGTAYMHVWMYAIREFEDAIDDCTTCTANCNEFSTNDAGPVHAWDEGVAFYAGSQEGRLPGGNSAGVMVYRLAEKRCGNFGTCTGTSATGISQVNDELFKAGGLFTRGRDLLHMGSCSRVRDVVDRIVSIMTVPLVQGTLRYAWKVGQTGGKDNMASDQNAKNAAEGSTFAAAVLPLVHACDAAAAKVVSDHMKFGAAVYDKTTGDYVSGTKPDTAAVKAALEKTYTCLGITCAHVGGLLNGAKTAAEAGMEDCTPAPAAKITGAKKVTVEVKAAGDVSDYDATKKATVEAAMAKVAEVDANAVTVTVKAGSVILTFVIITDDPAAVKATVATALKDKALASTALGVTVEEVPTVAVVSVASSDDDGLSTGAVVGIAVGALVGLLLIGGIAFKVMSSKNVNPKEHSPA